MKEKLNSDYSNALSTYGTVNKMVIAVKLPTGATEIIMNTEYIESKVAYYNSAYDNDMCLVNNSNIQVVAWMFV